MSYEALYYAEQNDFHGVIRMIGLKDESLKVVDSFGRTVTDIALSKRNADYLVFVLENYKTINFASFVLNLPEYVLTNNLIPEEKILSSNIAPDKRIMLSIIGGNYSSEFIASMLKKAKRGRILSEADVSELMRAAIAGHKTSSFKSLCRFFSIHPTNVDINETVEMFPYTCRYNLQAQINEVARSINKH